MPSVRHIANMCEQTTTAVELLSNLADIIKNIAVNLDSNRLDRYRIRNTLKEYARRAESDGRLINASRQNSQCAEHGLFLAFIHMEFIDSLVKYNFTIPASSVKWYNCKSLFKKYRLSLFGISSQTNDLENQLKHLQENAELLYADFEENNIRIPPTPITYRKVPACAPMAAPLKV
ncbi:hypothetical protein AWENTII_011035 [Aspergillus wentii]